MVALTLGGLHSSGVVVEADMIMMMDVTCLLPVRVMMEISALALRPINAVDEQVTKAERLAPM